MGRGRAGTGRRPLASRSERASTQEQVSLAKRTLEEALGTLVSTEAWMRALRAQARFHRYSWNNVLLIHRQRPDATRVAGFGTWLRLGRHVRKGERGIAILAPMRVAKKVVDAVTGEERDDSFLYYRAAYVFDIAQTDGDDLPEAPKQRLEGDGEVEHLLVQRLTAALAERGLPVRMVAARHAATDEPLVNGVVQVRADDAPAQVAKDLAHAFAHSLLGHTGSGAREECEAESAAFIAFEVIGVQAGAYSFGHIGQWSGGDTRVLSEAGRAAGRAATKLLEVTGFAPEPEGIAAAA